MEKIPSPKTNEEKFLYSILTEDIANLPFPRSNQEVYLEAIARKVGNNGNGNGGSTSKYEPKVYDILPTDWVAEQESFTYSITHNLNSANIIWSAWEKEGNIWATAILNGEQLDSNTLKIKSDKKIESKVVIVDFNIKELKQQNDLAKDNINILSEQVRQATEIVNKNEEIISKGNFATQGDIAQVNSQLEQKANQNDVINLQNNKANKTDIFSMANMGQDVKEAMTGGSVAVVGKNTILTENIVDGQIGIEKISNNLLDDFNGYEIDISTSSTTSDVAFSTKVGFDVSDVDITNKNITVNFDFYSEDTNIVGINSKLYQGTSLNGYQGSNKLGNKVENTSKKYIQYSYDFTFSSNSDFLTLFIAPLYLNSTIKSKYYIRNINIIIDGVVYNYKAIDKHNATNYTKTFIKNLPKQILKKNEFANKFKESLANETEKYDCFSIKALAKLNSVNIQPVFVFNLQNLELSLEEEFELSFLFKNRSSNLTDFKIEIYFNDTFNAGSVGGVSYKPSTFTTISELETNFYFKGNIKSIVNKYMHVFITCTVLDSATITEFDIIKPTLKIKGVKVERADTVNLYGNSDLKEIIYKDYNETQLATIGWCKANNKTGEYEGKKWNCLGDSITKGYGTTITYHDYISKKYGITNRNYGVVGTNIAGEATTYGDSMVNRYVDMNIDADIVTVFGGTNDFTNNIPLGTIESTDKNTFYGALNILMKGLSEKYIGKGILFITPFNYKDTPNSNGNTLLEFVEAIKECGKKYSIPVYDAYSNSGLFTVNSNIRPTIAIDTKHLNEKGHSILASRIEQKVLSVINTFA